MAAGFVIFFSLLSAKTRSWKALSIEVVTCLLRELECVLLFCQIDFLVCYPVYNFSYSITT